MAGLKAIGRLGSIAGKAPTAPAKAPPPPKAEGRPPLHDRPTLFPRGPKVLGLGVKRIQKGPGPKPADFDGSQPEWVWYWASKRKLSPHEDPRVGPYTGARDGSWLFQVPEGGEHVRQVGSSISDFVYLEPRGMTIVRIEGFYWHTNADPATQARDAYLTAHASNEGTRVERVEDSEFMFDPTGEAAVRLLAEILGGRSFVGAVHGGIAQPPRYAEFV